MQSQSLASAATHCHIGSVNEWPRNRKSLAASDGAMENACLVWCYTYGVSRYRGGPDEQCGSGDEPPEPRLSPRLCRVVRDTLAASARTVAFHRLVGVLRIQPKQRYNSVMTALSEAERASMALCCVARNKWSLGFLRTLHSFRILHKILLPTPVVPIVSGEALGRKPRSTIFELTPGCVEECASLPLPSGETMAARLARAGWEPPSLAVAIPVNVAGHIFGECDWGEVCLRRDCSGENLFPGWLWDVPASPCMQRRLECGINFAELEADSVKPYMSIAELLRACASRDIHHPEEVPLRESVLWLEKRVAALQMPPARRAKEYSMSTLVHTMILSKLLKDAARLKDAVILALRVTLPSSVAQQYELLLRRKAFDVPRRSTVYRHQLTMHAAFLLMRRAQWEGAVAGDVSWLTVDSSPQGGGAIGCWQR